MWAACTDAHLYSALGFNLSIIEAKDIAEAVDPEDSGLVSYELFLEVAAMKIRGLSGHEQQARNERSSQAN